MTTLSPDIVRVHADKEAVSKAAAKAFVELAQASIRNKGRFSVALAGGSTPRLMYELLAGPMGITLYWEQIHIYFGDERYVPHTHEKSNYRMAREALLDAVPIAASHVYPIPTSTTPANDAEAYTQTLHRTLAPNGGRFDLVLLGLGDDGHTASLFPGTLALEEEEQWAVAAPAPVEPQQRITLTYPVLNLAHNVHFLVSGSSKTEAIRCVFSSSKTVLQCPAAHVLPEDGALVWWVDEEAAEKVRSLRSQG